MTVPLGGPHHLPHGGGEALPVFILDRELALSLRRELVEFGAAIVFGNSPARADPSLLLDPVQRRIERSLLDPQRVAGCLLDAQADAVAVQRPAFEHTQDQHVERALQHVLPGSGHGTSVSRDEELAPRPRALSLDDYGK